MVDSINIPQNLTKVIEVRDTSDQLRRFLIDILIRVQNLEKSNKDLEAKVATLLGP